MQAAVFSFSARGAALSKAVGEYLSSLGYSARVATVAKYAQATGLAPMVPDYKAATAAAFADCQIIIYIGATGIAVRAIAPYLRHKDVDPAIISIDEGGNFVIPLLAGHIGGANGLARAVAAAIGGTACVTTATDVNGLFAIDEWAARNHMAMDSLSTAKDFAAALVAGKQVGLYYDEAFTVTRPLPKLIAPCNEGTFSCGMAITVKEGLEPFPTTVRLVPKAVYLGIGCRRNTPLEKIEALVLPKLAELGFDWRSIVALASVDLKKDEEGLLAFAKKYHLAAHFYTAAELNSVEGDFTPSAFVQSIVGVSNVCERSAVFASKGGQLLLKKTSLEGVTLAVAVKQAAFDLNKTGLKLN